MINKKLKQSDKKHSSSLAESSAPIVLSTSLTYDEAEKIRLDKFLAETLDSWTRSQIKLQIDGGGVSVNDKVVTKAGTELKSGDNITLNFTAAAWQTDAQPEDIALDIVYEDEDIAVINKPQGMVVHPAPGSTCHTLVNALCANNTNIILFRWC